MAVNVGIVVRMVSNRIPGPRGHSMAGTALVVPGRKSHGVSGFVRE